ncbi:MAG TPA: squalene--hopene cyclase [Oleiagrimonas sp.]|nr:squalene--hopene cyclase [Oleiagrimonas sp.]
MTMRDISDENAVTTCCQPVSRQPDTLRLEAAIAAARKAALDIQHDNGHWCHELEADCTIPAEYVLMLHYFGEREPAIEAKIGVYLRRRQGKDGGWPLYEAGAMDVSCSVKVYFALKLMGDDPDAEHMRRARKAIQARGGAARSNVFTRITLALFGELPWRGVPVVPVELVLLPRWFPIHLLKISYWSRTVVTPLAVLCSLKPRAANPLDVHVRELFLTPPEEEKHYFPEPESHLARLFLGLDKLGHLLDAHAPRWLRRHALKRAEQWMLPRLNGVDGLGAIFPAMVNACEALALLGYPADSPLLKKARKALSELLIEHGDEAYCQPCVSPVWDTGLTCLAMQEDACDVPQPELDAALDKAHAWLLEKQLVESGGDWKLTHPGLAGGGWAFQYQNTFYPDLDDTAVVAWTLHQSPRRDETYVEAITRAADWLVGMQSENGGFASFDADNNHGWLNEIPFADHGALLDPPTSDVSARVLTLLAQLDRPQDRQARERVLDFLRREQTPDGCWFGRWGTNYIYGTWSVLTAFQACGIAPGDQAVRRAVAWLKQCQRDDGSWGETNDSYFDPELAGVDTRGNAAQTAWALLGLMAAGETRSRAVARGARWLVQAQDADGHWHDAGFNAPGFPRVFYLKYHGYSQYFPYWALVRYRHGCHVVSG